MNMAFTGRTALLIRMATIGRDVKTYTWATALLDRMARYSQVAKEQARRTNGTQTNGSVRMPSSRKQGHRL